MDSETIKHAVNDYHSLVAMKEQFEKRLDKFNGRNPDVELSIMEKIEHLENEINFIDYAAFEANFLSDKEQLILSLRMDGFTFQEIGKFIKLNRNYVARTVNGIYEKMAQNYMGI